jgi:hypothetical protein
MPTFNILLAHDTTYYGCVEVEADTWEDCCCLSDLRQLVRQLHDGDEGWEQRVVDVETENGDIVADGINYNCALVHCSPIIHRLTTILDTCACRMKMRCT